MKKTSSAIGIGAIMLVLFVVVFQQQTDAQSALLFTDAPSTVVLSVNDASVLRSKTVRLNLSEWKDRFNTKQALEFELFDSIRVTASPTKIKRFSNTRLVWHGIVNEDPTSSVLLAFHDNILVGDIHYHDKLYTIRYLGDQQQLYVLREIDPEKFSPKDLHLQPPLDDPATAPDGATEAAASEEDGTIIDVMVAYTPNAELAAGGTAAMLAEIDLAMATANAVNENSGVTTEFWLIHAAEVTYDEQAMFNAFGGDYFSEILSDLWFTADGNMDEVHTLRDDYGADIVSLLIEDGSNTDTAGIAYVMGSPPNVANYDEDAFNVVDREYASSNYSLAHEMGHNAGLAHNPEDVGAAGAYSYAYGYRDPGFFRTVMSYDCAPDGLASCPRVPYWSNPSVTYNGRVTGVVNANDNARAFNNTKSIVANFRNSACIPPGIGGWIVNGANSPCRLYGNYVNPGIVTVNSDGLLYVAPTATFDIDFDDMYLKVEDGGGILVHEGGKIY